jgi:hypothetical protein
MPKISDRERVLRLLRETEGLSSRQIKTELDLSDDRYDVVRTTLLDDGLVRKYVCRGGGIRLTPEGDKATPTQENVSSTVDRESHLYQPLVALLEAQAKEDSAEVVVCATDSLRARGKWQNPDVTHLAIEYYQHLRQTRIIVTTYEVKQFPRWTVDVVYEAASHRRFSHEAYVVLEWPNGIEFSLTDPSYKIDQIFRECQRFNVGLATLHPYYNSYRLRERYEAAPNAPKDEDIETWLEYMFERAPSALKVYDDRMRVVQNRLAKGRTD